MAIYLHNVPGGMVVWRCRPFPIFRGRSGKGLAHSHRRSRSGLHPKLGASQNESAYGEWECARPFPSPLKMGKGRQRQTT